MFEHILKGKNGSLSLVKTLAAIALLTFIVGLLIQGLQANLAVGSAATMPVVLLTALLLAVILAGLMYPLVLRPVTQYYEARLRQAARSEDPQEISITDPVTRTLNRRGITIGLFDLMALGDRYGHQLSIALVDIDRLRHINERHGTGAGDQVLAAIAGILADALRMPDRVGRFSDNEFLLVLPETDLSAACKLAERVRRNTSRTAIDVNGDSVKTTISVGVTQFRKGEDFKQLISRAGQAIRQAKDKGRNTVVCSGME